jgi:hypothetical protein
VTTTADIQPLAFDPSQLRGLSKRLIESHFCARERYAWAADRKKTLP